MNLFRAPIYSFTFHTLLPLYSLLSYKLNIPIFNQIFLSTKLYKFTLHCNSISIVRLIPILDLSNIMQRMKLKLKQMAVFSKMRKSNQLKISNKIASSNFTYQNARITFI